MGNRKTRGVRAATSGRECVRVEAERKRSKPSKWRIQYMYGSLGGITGKGLASNIKIAFSPTVLHGVVLFLLIANTLNIAADVAAIAEVAAASLFWLKRHAGPAANPADPHL